MTILTSILLAATLAFFVFQMNLADSPAPLSTTARKIAPRQGGQWIQAIVTLAILGVALYIILSHGYQAQDKHWGYGAAGTILGYWGRSK